MLLNILNFNFTSPAPEPYWLNSKKKINFIDTDGEEASVTSL
jgi:hypothetical protein